VRDVTEVNYIVKNAAADLSAIVVRRATEVGPAFPTMYFARKGRPAMISNGIIQGRMPIAELRPGFILIWAIRYLGYSVTVATPSGIFECPWVQAHGPGDYDFDLHPDWNSRRANAALTIRHAKQALLMMRPGGVFFNGIPLLKGSEIVIMENGQQERCFVASNPTLLRGGKVRVNVYQATKWEREGLADSEPRLINLSDIVWVQGEPAV
jgi:hypothetical protein